MEPPAGSTNTEAFRNATPEDVARVALEKEATYSRTIDEVINSRGEKGQYFAVFGKPSEDASEPDGRLIVFTEKINLKPREQREGETLPPDEEPNFIGLTRDGFVAIPVRLAFGRNQSRDGESLIDNELTKQINSFYSSTDRSALDTYPTSGNYDGETYRFHGPPTKKNAFLKSPTPQDQNRIVFPEPSSSHGEAPPIDLTVWTKKDVQQIGVKEFDDMEIIKQVIATSQEKARSPHEAKAAEAMEELQKAKDISSFISSLPPKA